MQEQLAEAWGQFLSGYPWDWFCTFTFRSGDDPPSSFRAHRLFGSFMRDVTTRSEQPVFWFRGDEYGPRGGRLHIHALVGNVAAERRLYWMDQWDRRAGYARILPFDPNKGAAFYCSKYVTKQFGDWNLSDNLTGFRQNQPILAGAAAAGGELRKDRKVVVRRSPALQPEIEARCRRTVKLYCYRRDWETDMLRNGRRWCGG
jgi:hypothetical protein